MAVIILGIYREKATIRLGEKGFSRNGRLKFRWVQVQWYLIDKISSSFGTRRVIVKTSIGKFRFQAKDDEEFQQLTKHFVQKLTQRNPAAYDFRSSAASKRTGAIVIISMLALYAFGIYYAHGDRLKIIFSTFILIGTLIPLYFEFYGNSHSDTF